MELEGCQSATLLRNVCPVLILKGTVTLEIEENQPHLRDIPKHEEGLRPPMCVCSAVLSVDILCAMMWQNRAPQEDAKGKLEGS